MNSSNSSMRTDNLFHFIAEVVATTRKAYKSYWVENPDHREKLDIWKTSYMKRVAGHALSKLAKFDQCRFGAETTKPTVFATDDLDFEVLNGRRCNHEVQEWTRPDGSKYESAHESLAQRWRAGPTGERERASKALAEYPPMLNLALAVAMCGADHDRVLALRES